MKTAVTSYARALLIVALSTVATTGAVSAGEGTSAETKARMIQLVDKLESDPFAANGDQRAINIAGVEGVLRTYAAMKSAKPKLAIGEIDQLVKLQAAGQLGAAVDAGLAECG